MTYNVNQLKTDIIEPTLRVMEMYSPQALNLLLGTMAKESEMGTYLVQKGGGPAQGAYQMEPATHDDIVKNYIVNRKSIVDLFVSLGYPDFHSSILKYDLRYATMFARLHYRRKREPLPVGVEEMASYWKRHYNTSLGKGTVEGFISSYKKYVD